jgi:hypothetical protein
MTLELQFSGGNDIKGFDKRIVEQLCLDRFKQSEGWVHVHFKTIKDSNERENPHIIVQANSMIGDRKISADVSGFGVESTMKALLTKLEAQLN